MNQRQLFKRKLTLKHEHPDPFDEQLIECAQTMDELDDLKAKNKNHQQNCTCQCACKVSTNANEELNPADKKKIKRKEYNKRKQIRQKENKQKAMKELQIVMKDIYALKQTFITSRDVIERCLELETSKDKFYEFINLVIREQVDSIRQQIRTCLNELSLNVENSNIIPRLFEQFSRVKEASPEIEKIINLFVRREFKSKGEFLPYQRNLDKMTLKFILKNDLQNREHFGKICEIIFRDQANHDREKQMLKSMLELFDEEVFDLEDDHDLNQEDPHHLNQEEQEFQQTHQVIYDSYSSQDEDPQDGGVQTNQYTLTNQYDIDIMYSEEDAENQENKENQSNINEKRMRQKRKKRGNEEFQSTFEIIIKRMMRLKIQEQLRVPCHVTEDWLERMKVKNEKMKVKNEQMNIKNHKK